MLEVFAIRLAAGFAFALLILPRHQVEPRFYRLHLTIAACFLAAASVFAWQRAGDWFWLPFSLGFLTLLIGAWAWSFAEYDFARLPALVIAPTALLASLLVLTPAEPWTAGLDHVSSAAVLGLTTTAMLLGHWYLIAPNLSLQPLLRLHHALFIALAVRTVLVAGLVAFSAVGLPGLQSWAQSTLQFDKLAWLWLATRVLAGLIGAAVLTWMSFRAAVDSTQSATGILYVVTIFVFVGELTDQLLRQHPGETW
jgi:hypothetical protein